MDSCDGLSQKCNANSHTVTRFSYSCNVNSYRCDIYHLHSLNEKCYCRNQHRISLQRMIIYTLERRPTVAVGLETGCLWVRSKCRLTLRSTLLMVSLKEGFRCGRPSDGHQVAGLRSLRGLLLLGLLGGLKLDPRLTECFGKMVLN